MPVYEYKCKKCGEKFELRLGFFHNKNDIKCPKCGAKALSESFLHSPQILQITALVIRAALAEDSNNKAVGFVKQKRHLVLKARCLFYF